MPMQSLFSPGLCPIISYLSLLPGLCKNSALAKAYWKSLMREVVLFQQSVGVGNADLKALLISGGDAICSADPGGLDTFGKLIDMLPFAALPQVSIEISFQKITKKNIVKWQEYGVNRICLRADMKKMLIDDKDSAFLVHLSDFFDVLLDLTVDVKTMCSERFIILMQKVAALPIAQIGFSFLLEGDSQYWITAYQTVADVLISAGFFQYDLLHFARQWKMSTYVMSHMNRESYIGFGSGAESCNGTVRTRNYKSVKKYNDLLRMKGYAWRQVEKLSDEQRWIEAIIMRMRLASGVAIQEIVSHAEKMDKNIQKSIAQLIEDAYIEQVGDSIRLTPSGLWVEDEVGALLTN